MEKLLLLDMSAIFYKSHFALFNLKNSKGKYTGATLGTIRQINSAIEKFKPNYIAAAYDVKRAKLERTKIFDEYKGNRASMPIELVEQIDDIKNLINYYGINSFSSENYEADDVIASLTNFATNKGVEVHILTGDKDLQQLIRKENDVFIHLLSKDKTINTEEDVKEYMGVYPYEIPDLFGLQGDSSDGIPGVKGVGSVTGVKLISEYGTLEKLYENICAIKGKLKEKLETDKEMAFVSRQLATVNRDIDFNITLDDLKQKEKKLDEITQIFKKLELNSLIEEYGLKKTKLKIEYEDVTYEEIITKISNAKIVSMYDDDNFFTCCIDNKVYIYTKEKDLTLFSKPFTLKDLCISGEAVVFDAKEFMHKGVKFNNFFDVLVAHYVINTRSNFEIEKVIESYIDIDFNVIEKRKKNIDIELLKDNSVKICYGLYVIKDILKEKLKEVDTKNTYEIIEKPMISVLYKMEKRGIKISKEKFEKINKEFSKLIEDKTKEIFEIANKEFNLDSPTQLAEVLFNDMGIKPIKKNKKSFSTDAEVLEELSSKGYEIADKLLEYRSYKKLLSTYIEPLPKFADENNRIHSSFNGTGTVTGRLSSLNPNLQNIPTRSAEGTMIRNCFVSEENKKLVSFDYSQIELRVLAQVSKDEKLIKAYKEDLDLHTLTAKKLFPNSENITKNQRNIAKTINFSVLYGKTSYGLSKELKIGIKEAELYIKKYFEEYPRVPEFISEVVEKVKQDLYVETLFGTKRYISEIKSNNSILYEQAKRMAINTLIQGTAANVIKLVMIELDKRNYNMLLQVHDELIFEIDDKDVEIVSKEIQKIMEETIKFENVKLKVNCEIADNWGDLK